MPANPHRPTKYRRAADAGRSIFLWWLCYVGFVIYGSLLPFDFTPLPAGTAYSAFLNTPFLNLGIESRADWIANGVLYLPVGFLSISWLRRRGSSPHAGLAAVAALVFCLALALTIEFTQLYFPPRTVSRNDIIAEAIGSLVGILLATRWDAWFHNVLQAFSERIGQLIPRLLQAYVVGYLFFNLFPFDFLLSAEELSTKLDSDTWGWLIAPASLSRGLIPLAAKLGAEVLSVIPIGLLLARSKNRGARPRASGALFTGFALGLVIELIQFFIFSGVSEGISLVTRALGVYAGTLAWQRRQSLAGLPDAPVLRRFMPGLTVIYLLLLSAVNGWYSHPWHGLNEAGEVLAQTRFLLFYYHYYTTEQAALISLASVVLMYAPFGLLTWLRKQTPTVAFWLAGLAALLVESSKMFIAELHPDPTNLLIAGLSAWGTATLTRHLTSRDHHETPLIADSCETPVQNNTTAAGFGFREGTAVLVSLACATWLAIDFPFHPLAGAALLLIYTGIIWARPHWIWFAIPAALPLLDLAPWSGRFYWDEFDYLLLVSVAVGWARTENLRGQTKPDRGWLLILAALALIYVFGTVRGAPSFAPPDLNSFSNYFSPFNGLRQAKGVFAALLLALLWPRFYGKGQDPDAMLTKGMLCGLAGVALIVLWERISFPGLLEFSDVYRVTGPFSAMHIGGADLETYLTCAVPFALLLIARSASRWFRILAAGSLLLAAYALMVSFSRIGYIGFAVAVGCMATLLWRNRSSNLSLKTGMTRHLLWGALFTGGGLLIALPFFHGNFAQERFAMTGSDLAIRQAHWADAMEIRDPGLLTELLGMGLGRYPETHYWRSSESKAASYQLGREAGNTFLRLGTGSPTYIEQFVPLLPNTDYTLEMDIRSRRAETAVNITMCEKWLLTSGACVNKQVINQAANQWERQAIRLNSEQLGNSVWPFRKTSKLSLSNSAADVIEIDNVRLLDPAKNPLILNGDFSSGLDRWFMSADRDLPWHIWSMPVAVVFDLGWAGLFSLCLIAAVALRRMLRSALDGNMTNAAMFSAMLGILVIGSMDTVIDAPRMLFLFVLLIAVGSQHWLPTKNTS